ncbi:MAG: protein kinase domain-containing protein [Planctomycetales bacterium]
MNTKPTACDDRQLQAMLRSANEDGPAGALLMHVEQCARCQTRLEELAADPEDWKKAGDALASRAQEGVGDPEGDLPTVGGFSHWIDGPVSWTEAMARQLLSPPSHPEMLGRLGRYEVERMVGAGGMGVVFKAFDSELNRPVAVKVLAPYLAGSGPARKRFAREARAAAAIVHEHVVPIHNVETERDAPFLVMQYIAGESLQARLDRTGPLQTCEILRIGMQIASGLSAAHQQGLVHRDIKPSNILLEQGVERALITDFGLARAADDATLTRSGFHPGTPQFMSPEQAAGEPVDARSDLFSLGSVLYTLCTGRPPFRADSSLGVLRRITDAEPRRIRELNPQVPEWLCGIIGKLMAKRPSDRYRSAAAVAALLEPCLAHVQQPEFIPLPDEARQMTAIAPETSPAHVPGRTGRRLLISAMFAIVALAGLLAAYWRPPDSVVEPASLKGGAPAAERTDKIGKSRVLAPISHPVIADEAPIVACIGPEYPVRLGELVSHAEINRGVDPSIVRLHVWDWSQSDLSRVLLVQRSEVGALSPDGSAMLTTEGESMELATKRTRQYSGFRVPEAQRITALYVSPKQNYASAIIHVRTDIENLPTDPPTVDARHFWNLRLLRLEAATNTGHRIGEFPADSRPGVAFTADETAVVYSTDQHSIVRRELPSGRLLNNYNPSLGVHGAVGLAVSKDGHFVAAAGYHGTIRIWEAQTGALRLEHASLRPNGERDEFFKAAVLRFSLDGTKLAMVSGNHVKIMDTKTGNIRAEHQDAARPRYVQVHWSGDARSITLLASSQLVQYAAQPTEESPEILSAGQRADRLPRLYEWNWETGSPEVKQFSAVAAPHASRIDPEIEAQRFTGTWRIADRSTAGVEQTSQIGQTVKVRQLRMEEACLQLDPNQTPKTVDVVFLEGPEKGKVLRGIYEWIPDRRAKSGKANGGAGKSLRICTFIEPHPDRPDERPHGFQPGKDVDTAIWECVSPELPEFKQKDRSSGGRSKTQERLGPLPVDVDDIELPTPKGRPASSGESAKP